MLNAETDADTYATTSTTRLLLASRRPTRSPSWHHRTALVAPPHRPCGNPRPCGTPAVCGTPTPTCRSHRPCRPAHLVARDPSLLPTRPSLVSIIVKTTPSRLALGAPPPPPLPPLPSPCSPLCTRVHHRLARPAPTGVCPSEGACAGWLHLACLDCSAAGALLPLRQRCLQPLPCCALHALPPLSAAALGRRPSAHASSEIAKVRLGLMGDLNSGLGCCLWLGQQRALPGRSTRFPRPADPPTLLHTRRLSPRRTMAYMAALVSEQPAQLPPAAAAAAACCAAQACPGLTRRPAPPHPACPQLLAMSPRYRFRATARCMAGTPGRARPAGGAGPGRRRWRLRSLLIPKVLRRALLHTPHPWDPASRARAPCMLWLRLQPARRVI